MIARRLRDLYKIQNGFVEAQDNSKETFWVPFSLNWWTPCTCSCSWCLLYDKFPLFTIKNNDLLSITTSICHSCANLNRIQRKKESSICIATYIRSLFITSISFSSFPLHLSRHFYTQFNTQTQNYYSINTYKKCIKQRNPLLFITHVDVCELLLLLFCVVILLHL